jgi:mutator protein MutT
VDVPERLRAGGAQIIPRPPRWAPGRPPPWAGATIDHVDLDALLDRIRGRHPAAAPVFPGARSSAVLIALFDGPEGAEVILTRRAQHLTTHKGEVSFPGGRLDPGETPQQAALREAWEEVSLDPREVTLVGELDHLATVVSRSLIVPVVGSLARRPELRATSEVDRILTVPLVDLLRPGTYREELWGDPPLDRAIHFFELDDETVWGATARMLVQLLGITVGVDAEVRGW